MDNNFISDIVTILAIILTIGSLIMGIIAYMEKSKYVPLNKDGLVNPNEITITDYLKSGHADKFFKNYFHSNIFDNFVSQGNNAQLRVKLDNEQYGTYWEYNEDLNSSIYNYRNFAGVKNAGGKDWDKISNNNFNANISFVLA